MSWNRAVAIATLASFVACVVALSVPAPARAGGGWGWPIDGPISLEYGAQYTNDQGRSCSHGGIDITGSAGAGILACGPGEVVFSGLVPAGEGARTWAVTVLTADGLKVTYMPLERASVKRGDAVSSGDPIGAMAEFGDASGTGSHLHLSVRRGEHSLDPRSLLSEITVAAGGKRAPVVSTPKSSKTPARSSAPAPVSAPAPGSVPAASAAAVDAPAVSVPVADLRTTAGSPLALSVPAAIVPDLGSLRRIPSLSTAPRVKTAEVAADVGRLRDALASVLVRLALAGLAGLCMWPALRGVLAARTSPGPARTTVRSENA